MAKDVSSSVMFVPRRPDSLDIGEFKIQDYDPDTGIWWTNRPLQAISNHVTTKIKYYFPEALNKNLTKYLDIDFSMIGKNPMNLIMSVEGPQGDGKSYSIADIFLRLMSISGLKFGIDYVDFSYSDKNRSAKDTRHRCAHILDEQPTAYGLGTGAEREMLLNIEKVIRKYKQCFGLLSPEYVRHHHHFHLLTWQWGSRKEWNFNKKLDTQWEFNRLIVFDRNMYPIGYIITETPYDKKFMNAYEKKKDDFLNDMFEGTVSNRESELHLRAEELWDNVKFMKLFNKGHRLGDWRGMASIGVGSGFTIEEKNRVADYLLDWSKNDSKIPLEEILDALRNPEQRET